MKAKTGEIGYQDIISNAKGGDTILLRIEANCHAFARNIKAEFEVIKKIDENVLEQFKNFKNDDDECIEIKVDSKSFRSSYHPLMNKLDSFKGSLSR